MMTTEPFELIISYARNGIRVSFTCDKDVRITKFYADLFGDQFLAEALRLSPEHPPEDPAWIELVKSWVRLMLIEAQRHQEHYDFTADAGGYRTPILHEDGTPKPLIPRVSVGRDDT